MYKMWRKTNYRSFNDRCSRVGFTPLADEKKLKPRYLRVICDTCVDCGCIENIRVENTIVESSWEETKEICQFCGSRLSDFSLIARW